MQKQKEAEAKLMQKEKEMKALQQQAAQKIKEKDEAANNLKNAATKQIIAATEETKAAKKVIAQKNTQIKFEKEK